MRSKPSLHSKRSAALDPRPKFDDEEAQERKISSSAANPSRKRKKPKPEREEVDQDDELDLGAESKKFIPTGDTDKPIKKKKKVRLDSGVGTKPKSKVKKISSSKGGGSEEVSVDDSSGITKVKGKKPKLSTSTLKEKAAKNKAALESDMEEIDAQAEEFADSTWVNTYHVMFRKLRKIMRATENRVVDSEKAADIYALMALYNQMREVIADLRSMIDLSQNTQRIIDQVLYPLTRDISNNYVDSIYKTMKSLRMHVDGDKFAELRTELEKVMGEHGKYIQAAYEKSSQRLSDLLED